VSASRIAAFGFFSFTKTLAENKKSRFPNDTEGKTHNKVESGKKTIAKEIYWKAFDSGPRECIPLVA